MRRRGTLTLRREDGRIICESCKVADSTLRRMRGLLGRSGLRDEEGIVLRPAFSIHTGFMRFPIDVVFLDPDQTVVHIERELRPWKTATFRGAREVVELRAGHCERTGLEVGDRVAWASVAEEAVVPGVPAAPTPVSGRVVVASRDRRFVKLMRFVLDRHGFEVATSNRSDLLEVIEHERAAVVVLDAPESLVATGRATAAAKARYPDVAVVVVAEGGSRGEQTTFSVYDKWDGMDEVVESVTRAVGATPVA
jgi:uncharacterized membrane protein (UPF0127 family)/CheY-like chemotaxis protein